MKRDGKQEKNLFFDHSFFASVSGKDGVVQNAANMSRRFGDLGLLFCQDPPHGVVGRV